METEQPEPEPEPEVDASVQKVCIVIIMSFPVFQNFVILVRNEIKYYSQFRKGLENTLVGF